jgi:hypothetical protein
LLALSQRWITFGRFISRDELSEGVQGCHEVIPPWREHYLALNIGLLTFQLRKLSF